MSIFYFCPFSAKPVGGIKQIHRHVEALADAGIEAYVLTDRRQPPTWFATGAPLAVLDRPAWHGVAERLKVKFESLGWMGSQQGPQVELVPRQGAPRRSRLTRDDIVVLPEFFGRSLRACGFGARTVLFNQNAHYTYNGFTAQDGLDKFPYFDRGMTVIAVSQHNRDYLAHAFPGATVHLTINGVDTDAFRALAKKRQIAYMPRKLPRDLVQVLQIVRGRGRLAGWDLKPIDHMHESEVTRALGESAVFLSSCDEEGFGLPPLEAAACGCAVVGYTGYAAREFMRPDLCHPVDQGDVLGFATILEQVLASFDSDAQVIQAKAQAHAEFVRHHYSRQAERDSVLDTWADILGGQRVRRPSATRHELRPSGPALSSAA